MSTPEERARSVLSEFTRLEAELQRAIAGAIHAAVKEERQGLRTTLQLCVQTFDHALTQPGLSKDLRIAMRTCRGLCLAGLDEGEETAGRRFDEQPTQTLKSGAKGGRNRKEV